MMSQRESERAIGLVADGDGTASMQGGGMAMHLLLDNLSTVVGLRVEVLQHLLDTREDLKMVAVRFNADSEPRGKWGVYPSQISNLIAILDKLLFRGIITKSDYLPGCEKEPSINSLSGNERLFGIPDDDKPVQWPCTQPVPAAPAQPRTAQEMVDMLRATPPAPAPAPKPLPPIVETLAKFSSGRRTDEQVVALAHDALGGVVDKPTLLQALRGMKRSGALLRTLRKEQKKSKASGK